MNILFLSTVNGKLDEGMRNVATHIGKSLQRENHVFYVQLKDLTGILKNLPRANSILICARADKKLYYLVRLLSLFRPTSIILVQKPFQSFIDLNNKHPLNCKFFTISLDDIQAIKSEKKFKIDVGIDFQRFKPCTDITNFELKRKLGFDTNKCLVLHVGHCSTGRRVEMLCEFPSSKFERVLISSGMFEDSAIHKALEEAGVHIISGYIPNIEEYYQAADVYFFPTCSGDYVISVPLSVMEALACGTPVVAYDKLNGLKEIHVRKPQSVRFIRDNESVSDAALNVMRYKSEETLLDNPASWDSIADFVGKELNNRW